MFYNNSLLFDVMSAAAANLIKWSCKGEYLLGTAEKQLNSDQQLGTNFAHILLSSCVLISRLCNWLKRAR